jgi:hypothetical protein
MNWICPCGASVPDGHHFCRACGYHLEAPAKTSDWGLGGAKVGKLLTIVAAGFIAVAVGFALPGLFRTPGKATPAPAAPAHISMPGPPPVPTDPREQHLADLRKKRENLEWKMAFEREFAKKVARDAMKLSLQPLADPDERQYLMEQMDKEEQRIAQLVGELELVDAEIVEEGRQLKHKQTSVIPPSPVPAQPDPSAERIEALRQRRAEIAAQIRYGSALADDVYRDQFRCPPSGTVGAPATCAGREPMKYNLGEATQRVVFDLMGKVNRLGEEAKYVDAAIANLKAGRPEDWAPPTVPAQPTPEAAGAGEAAPATAP